jgi:hypothetical protein
LCPPKLLPQETLDYVYKELLSLWNSFKKEPFLGVDIDVLQTDVCSAMRTLQLQTQ